MIVIAEIGVNHNGDVSLAKELIDQSAEAGADIVKFQTFKAKNIVSKFAEQADYQKRNTGSSKSQLELVKGLELPDEAFLELADYSRSIGTEFPSMSRRLSFLISSTLVTSRSRLATSPTFPCSRRSGNGRRK